MAYTSPFSLNAPLAPLAPAAGGTGKLPPVTDARPFARPSGTGPSAPKPVQNNQAPVIVRAPAPAFPKPRVWIDKRIALCVRHHAKFCEMRRTFRADLAAWVASQPGYCPIRAAQEARMAEIRRARHS